MTSEASVNAVFAAFFHLDATGDPRPCEKIACRNLSESLAVSIVLVCQNKDPLPWLRALQAVEPSIDVQIWPHESRREDVDFALCWRQPEGVFANYPNLQCICSMGAGVDALIQDPSLPRHLPLLRIIDPHLTESMFEYLASCALDFLRRSADYRRQQAAHQWQALSPRRAADTSVGVMGLGAIGARVAQKFVSLGFKVSGWSRSPKQLPGIARCYTGSGELESFLAQTDILICLLPLTHATRGVLDRSVFAALPKAACVINVARGQHLVDADLLSVLDTDHLSAAYLDVFCQEPLPSNHPFWAHPKIHITPHVASITEPASVAEQIIDNYRRMRGGEVLKNMVDVERGY